MNPWLWWIEFAMALLAPVTPRLTIVVSNDPKTWTQRLTIEPPSLHLVED